MEYETEANRKSNKQTKTKPKRVARAKRGVGSRREGGNCYSRQVAGYEQRKGAWSHVAGNHTSGK